ncbi:hypothetical protein PRZ48_010688 [Zasmidium cellare]|uniref:Xylose isomerase-like TIM barrel domain-containing protein n=1 Tax=Zasmidium cellare TaxID=395010 RepID=A0ABR0E9B7_ZASCE|nr:hypothetical protein PRZ48_010688 [Zasmidium cellare]
MPKRKLEKEHSDDGSELSPPPQDLENGNGTVNGSKEAPTAKKRKTTKATKKVETEIEQPVDKPKRGRKTKVKTETEEQEEVVGGATKTPPKRGKKVKEEVEEATVEQDDEDKVVKTKRKRKTKEEKEAEMAPLAARTVGHKLFIGAHVSAAGGVHNAVVNSTHIGANAFALFLKSQRKWANPDLLADHCTSFHDHCEKHTYDQGKHVVPHGSYLVNLAHTDKARTEQAYTSYLDDLKRCERLGIKLYNIHPGNTVSNDRQEAIRHLAKNLNAAHKETKSVITLLENMAAGGNVLGSTFQDLADIIALIEDKTRIGVCIDTCHAFAGGYDLRTPEAWKKTMDEFGEKVGFEYLRAFHVNDSKAPLASHRDLHANIGTGFLGLRAFWNLVNEPRVVGLPLVLETPITVRDEEGNVVKDEKGKEKEDKSIWAEEIKTLERMVGMDVEGEEFKEIEERLARKGAKERDRVGEQVEKKREKDGKKAKGGKKRKGKESESEEGSEDEEAG